MQLFAFKLNKKKISNDLNLIPILKKYKIDSETKFTFFRNYENMCKKQLLCFGS